LKVAEISLCASPANPFARALIAKSADAAADLDRRLGALEHQQAMRDAPSRLAKAMAVRGEELRAAAEGRAYVAPLPDAPMTKGTAGGAGLVRRALEIAKTHRAAQEVLQPAAEAPAAKSAVSAAEGLIAAAQRRAAMMKAG
jgi:hypothetical protein